MYRFFKSLTTCQNGQVFWVSSLLVFLQHFRDGLRARAHLELFVDVANVKVHGVLADVELVGDFFVKLPCDECIEHRLFACGELVVGRLDDGLGHGFLECLNDHARDFAAHRRTTCNDFFRGVFEMTGLDGFLQIAIGPCLQRLENGVGMIVCREHHKLRVGHQWGERAHGFDPAFAWQVDVHENHVHIPFRHLGDGFLGRGECADALDHARGAQAFHQRFSQTCLVFDNGDAEELCFCGHAFFCAGTEVVDDRAVKGIMQCQIVPAVCGLAV